MEQWKPVVGWPGYEVSDLGHVRTISRYVTYRAEAKRFAQGQPIKRVKDTYGYWIVGVSANGYRIVRRVHHLVLEAFVGERPEGAITRHLNGDRADARLENLAWGTPSENNHDKVRHGTDRNSAKTECVNGHAYTAGNTYLKPSGHRDCRTCINDRQRSSTARRRSA